MVGFNKLNEGRYYLIEFVLDCENEIVVFFWVRALVATVEALNEALVDSFEHRYHEILGLLIL
jgi:diacylglycerol kinase